MIPSTRLVYEFNRKFDRFRTQYKKSLELVDILSLLNEAQTIVFKNRAKFTELNKEFRNELRFVEYKEVELEIENFDGYSIAKFPDNFYKSLRKRLIGNREECGDKEITIITMDTDDLTLANKNPFFKSSFQWEHCLGDEGKEGFYLFHNNDFKIKKVIIDYYKTPQEIHCPSFSSEKQYVDWNGKLIKKDQGLELEENLREIVDTAILIARADLGDVQDYKTKLDQIINVEKINQE